MQDLRTREEGRRDGEIRLLRAALRPSESAEEIERLRRAMNASLDAVGQWEKMGLFLLVQFDGSFFCMTVDSLIRDLGEPCSRDLVEMLERREASSIEEIGLYEVERSFHLTFRLRSIGSTQPWLEAIVGSKS